MFGRKEVCNNRRLFLGTVPPAAASFEFEKGTGKEEGNFSCTVSYLNR